MNGYVRDYDGKPTANVRVQVLSASTIATTRTDRRGFFVIFGLPPDVYSVEAEKLVDSRPYGYTHAYAYAEGVRINSDQTTLLAFGFRSYQRCNTFTRVSVDIDPLSQQFNSLDMRQMETRPPNVSMPIPLLPITYVWEGIGCL